MTDNTELRRLADELIAANDLFNESPQDNEVGDAWSLANDRFTEAASPEVILALIADLDQARNGMKHSCAIRLKKQIEQLETERDQLKAENEVLRKLASDTGHELRKASSWICREVEAGTKSATHWAVRLREKADQIDAAMGKGNQS